jgi:hypothetical protein
MRAFAGTSKKSRVPVALPVLARVTRIVVTLVAIQLSGLGHLAVDLLTEVDAMADETDCPNEKPGHDCPPGCPGCHCVHGGTAVPPSSLKTAVLPILDEGGGVNVRPCEADAPVAPLLPSIFRPPRQMSFT